MGERRASGHGWRRLDPAVAVLGIAALLLAGCGTESSTGPVSEAPAPSGLALPAGAPAADPITFTEVTQELGLDFVHRSGAEGQYQMPEVMSGGAAVFDYDGDGDLDLYLINAAGAANRLYRQEGDGSFVDRTDESGLGDTGFGMGVAVGDMDNDGDLDAYVTNWGPDVLYRNDGVDGNGAVTFSDVTAEAGVDGMGWSTSAAFFDYDRDGHLDLYVTRYVKFNPRRECAQTGGRRDYCGPTQFPGVHDVLFHNEGGLRLRDVSREAGIGTVEDAGLGVVCADFDNDGWMDVYVANDADPNNLWINQGDGTFVDEAVIRGAAFNRFGTGEAGMGVSAGDADGDGDLDLFVTHLIDETNTYYRNLGTAGFEDATAEVKLGVPSLSYTGFGTALFDFDNDGDLDVGVVNGAVKRRPSALAERPDWRWNGYAEPNLLLENRGGGRFAEVMAATGSPWSRIEVSRGFVPADLDRDGDLDLLVTSLDGPARLYRNDGGDRRSWIEIRVVDPRLRREARGARVAVETEERTYVRHAIGPGGYLTSTHPRIHLGLGSGSSSIRRFVVRWPNGVEEVFPGTPVRRVVVLRKGEGTDPSAGSSSLNRPQDGRAERLSRGLSP